jgi:hypothetical protein
MSRNGKIARLPHDIREALNRSLDDNEQGPEILDWLNKLPETRSTLDLFFNGANITKQNLSEWRQGGFREWLIRDDLRRKAGELSEGAQEIEATIEAPLLAGNLATVLAAQYAKLLTDWDGEPNPKIEAKLHMLRILCRDIALLQRTMHRATIQKNEFYQKLEDDDKEEIQQMKDRAVAPIMAKLQENSYAQMLGGGDLARRIAAHIAAIDFDLKRPRSVRTPDAGQTESHPVKPVKPSRTRPSSVGLAEEEVAPGRTQSHSVQPVQPVQPDSPA